MTRPCDVESMQDTSVCMKVGCWFDHRRLARHAMRLLPLDSSLQREGGIALPDIGVAEARGSSPSGLDGPLPFLLSERAANLFSSTTGTLGSAVA